MAKFGKGFLLGAVAGTLFALLTAKKSGPERQRAIADYVDDVTSATGDMQHATTRLGNAIKDLQRELKETLQPALKDISDDVTDFQFQAEGATAAMQEHLDAIEAAAGPLTDLTASDDALAGQSDGPSSEKTA
ncbi:YtxH domain-containing protein [Lacticaseibacillus yichunensis]|uniref:YtxH domain-containing protein n=1 Tax=Lacticaseibacillus yichunensis TaxID=2486015 RepID=A0ABW4CLZ9_9LACO|nr:YtxH domain-containing protein [Lacticaseibacillus yichunensis]